MGREHGGYSDGNEASTAGGTPFWNGARDEGNPDKGLLIEAPCREQTARSPPVFPQGTEGGKTKTPRDLTAHGRLIQTKPLQWEREEQDGTAT